jgi:hypothetical protein
MAGMHFDRIASSSASRFSGLCCRRVVDVGQPGGQTSCERLSNWEVLAMRRFMAVYTGNPDAVMRWNALDAQERQRRERAGMQAWNDWVTRHRSAIVDFGSPLGKTKRVDGSGVSDSRNALAAYVIVQAQSHEDAAALFIDHPHFTIFPGEAVGIMECLPLPARCGPTQCSTRAYSARRARGKTAAFWGRRNPVDRAPSCPTIARKSPALRHFWLSRRHDPVFRLGLRGAARYYRAPRTNLEFSIRP